MNEPTGSQRDQAPLLDLLPILGVLWSRRGLILLVAAAFVAAAFLYVAVTKPTYTANAVILVDPRGPRTTESDNVLPGIGSDSAAISSQLAVIGSRELLGAVFDTEGLAGDPEFSEPDLFSGLLGRTLTREMVFENFIDRVSVGRQGLTYVLDVSFYSEDPEKAARIVNAIVGRYITSQIEEKSDANADVSELLNSSIAGLQQDVLDAERAVEAFKVANGIFASGTGSTLVQAQVDQLNVQLLAAQDLARQADIKHQQAIAAGSSPQALISLSEILTSASAEKLREDYNTRAMALASAESSFGPRHPTLQKLRAELSEVAALMVREVERITQELEAGRDAAQSVVASIEAEIATAQTDANQSNRMEVELRQLERKADASRQVLEQFLRRSEETSQYQTLQFSDARVITKATSPLRATWPKPSLLLGVGAVLGLAVGCGTALLLGAPVPVAEKPARRRRTWFARPAARPRRVPAPAAKAPTAVPAVPTARPAAVATKQSPLATIAQRLPTPHAVHSEPSVTATSRGPQVSSNRRDNQSAKVKAAIAELRRAEGHADQE